jgi:hypothetical protein
VAHDAQINTGTGPYVYGYDLATGGSYPTVGLVAGGVVLVSPNTSTAPSPVTAANGLYVQPGTGTTWSVSGSVSVSNFPATQPVSVASLPLPSGAATAAKQPAPGTAGSASADVLSVQGVASMTPLKVDGSAVTQPVSVSNFPATQAVSGAVSVSNFPATQAVSVSNFPATQAVSAAALPLPAGAATAAKQPAPGTAGSASGDVLSVQGVASMTPLKVDGSGVTQPVSVSSLPALPAGTNTIGNVSAAPQTGAVYSGTTAVTPQYAVINTNASGPSQILAGTGGKKIRVLSYRFVADADVGVTFRDATAPANLTGAMATGAKGGGGGAAFSPAGHFETGVGNALGINLSAAIQVSGHLTYILV